MRVKLHLATTELVTVKLSGSCRLIKQFVGDR
jgi:hypothetical protein